MNKIFYNGEKNKNDKIDRRKHNRYAIRRCNDNLLFDHWDDNGAPACDERILYSLEYPNGNDDIIIKDDITFCKKLMGFDDKYCDFHFLEILKAMFKMTKE